MSHLDMLIVAAGFLITFVYLNREIGNKASHDRVNDLRGDVRVQSHISREIRNELAQLAELLDCERTQYSVHEPIWKKKTKKEKK